MIKSILVTVDGSIYTDAVLDCSIDLAKKLDAFLRVFSVVDVRIYEWVLNTGGEGYMPVIPSNVFHDESHKFHNDRANSLMESTAKKLQKVGVKFETTKQEGSPVEIICEFGRQADLIIMGARGDYAKWGDRLLGATLEAVSRQSHTPLLIVDKKYEAIDSVYCAYDRSEYSIKGLKLSAYLCGALKLPLEVVTIHNDEHEREMALEEAQKYLKPYNLEVKFIKEPGDPVQVLIQVTEQASKPAVLIMGSYGHSRIREAILGSTTVQVMRRAKKPILLAK